MKMKVLLIAGFLDAEVRKHDIFKKDSLLFHKLIQLFGLPERVGKLNDHAPWVRSIISSFEQRDDVELHVVAPQIRLKKSLVEYQDGGVFYHFFSSEWTSFLRKLNNYNVWKRLQRSGYYTRKIANRINPDIVVLSGSENPVISVSILYTNKYPRYCLCQTIYNNPERAKYATPNRINQETEKDVFRQLQYFGVFSKMHYDLLKQMQPNAQVFKYGYPSKGKLIEPTETEKQYDFVNFALMHGARKGTPDSIKALAIVKKIYPSVTLNIVGGCDEVGLANLKALVHDLDLDENVIFTPFFEKRSDLLLHVQKSRFAVLPCKMDHTAGTMSQSMCLGLPLIVYKTTGTPSFNREKECALIAEKGNVDELAKHMLTLMSNPEKAEVLKTNAREFQEKKAEDKKKNSDRLIDNFHAIIDNYKNGMPIPQEQLFNPNTDD